MHITLAGVHGSVAPRAVSDSLLGNLASSIHRLKDDNDEEGGFFIFGDLSIKVEGIFKLNFHLFENRDDGCFYIDSVDSIPFYVVDASRFMGAVESTALTRKFCSQGMRLRLRKPPRVILRKDGPASDEYLRRPHKGHRRTKTQRASSGPQMQQLESRPERPTSVPLQPAELRPALTYSPAPPHTPQQEMPSQQPETIIDPHLEAILIEQHRPSSHSPHATQSYAEPQQESMYPGDQPTQPLSYEQNVYNLPPMTSLFPEQILDHRFGQLAQSTQSGNVNSLSSRPIYYQQPLQYPLQHGVSGIAPSNPPNDKSLFPNIDNTQRMPQGTLQFDNRSPLTPATPIYEEAVDPMGNASQMTEPDEFHPFPNAGQNLSAGRMGEGLYITHSNGATQR